jgi:hypothetical protein
MQEVVRRRKPKPRVGVRVDRHHPHPALSRQRERDSYTEPSGNAERPFRRVRGIVVERGERPGRPREA